MNRVMRSIPWSDRRVSLALLIVVALIAMSLLSPYFLRPDNLLSMTQYGAVLGLLALGQSIVILGGGGGIDLSVGSTMSLSGVVFGLLAVNVGLDPWVAALGAIAAGALLGGINAALITLLRIPPLIATIATLYLFASAALVLTNGIDINGFDRSGFAFLGQSKIAGFPTQVVLVLLPAYVIAAIILSRTPAGRRIYETGNNAQAALLTGVNVRATRAGLYITSGALAGVAAVVNASWLLNAKAAAGSGMELQSITIAVLGGIVITGGIGRVSGTLLGLVLVVILNSGLQLAGVSNTWQIGLLGAVLIVSVLIDTLRVRRQRT